MTFKNPLDVSYFDTAFANEPVKLTPVDKEFIDDVNPSPVQMVLLH